MSKFGGSKKFGGGAKFGGGPSVYEELRDALTELLGRYAFDTSQGTTVWSVFGSVAGQAQGAKVDGDRIKSEGIPALSIETIDEWPLVFFLERSNINDDGLRETLEAYLTNHALVTSASRVDAQAEEMMTATGDGHTAIAVVYQCTMSQCTATDNAGDGCRYVAVMVPEWFWDYYRPWFRAVQEWCDRSDAIYGETTLCCSNEGEPWSKDVASDEPAFYCNASLVDRDVVRN